MVSYKKLYLQQQEENKKLKEENKKLEAKLDTAVSMMDKDTKARYFSQIEYEQGHQSEGVNIEEELLFDVVSTPKSYKEIICDWCGKGDTCKCNAHGYGWR